MPIRGRSAADPRVVAYSPGGDFAAALVPDMDLSKVAAAAGGHRELVSDPDELEAAIARSLGALRSGKTAVVLVRVMKL